MIDKTKANDIKKALECCIFCECDDCPHDEETACKENLNQEAFNLIAQYEAEIERLQKHNTVVAHKHYNDGIKDFWELLQVRGKELVDYYTPEGCDFYFANGTQCGYVAMKEAGEQLVKVMVGDNNV